MSFIGLFINGSLITAALGVVGWISVTACAMVAEFARRTRQRQRAVRAQHAA